MDYLARWKELVIRNKLLSFPRNLAAYPAWRNLFYRYRVYPARKAAAHQIRDIRF
jgi:hypothetical protein